MTAICKAIFRAIHEGKWLYIEYQNKNSMRTKFWVAVHGINLARKSLEVTGLHLGKLTTDGLSLYVEKIISAKVVEGTFYGANAALAEDIGAFPQKYSALFPNIANLRTLNYLCDCSRLSDLPKLNTDYALVSRLDSSKITGRTYTLDDWQFRSIVASFRKRVEKERRKTGTPVLQLALNVLSVSTPKGLYVLAYREVRLDVERRTLVAGSKIKTCTEFCVAKDADGKNIRQSITNFLDNDDITLLGDFEANAEAIKDAVMQGIKNRKGYSVDDLPYFLCIQRNINADLEKEYEAIAAMYARNEPTVPIQAFFGELYAERQSGEVLPLALINRNVNLDQLLAIHNAMHFPVAYIQGPPGTGKTTTIISTIITAFFNSKTVLFSSYNNHPIDGVLATLSSLKYKSYTVPFPVLRIGSNEIIPQTCRDIKKLLASAAHLKVFDDALRQNRSEQIERTRRLSELLQKHRRKIDLTERAELIETMLSKNENMNLRMNLEGQQLSEIQKELSEIGGISDEDALALIDFDRERLMQFINFTSVRFIKKLLGSDYDDFRAILDMQDEGTQTAAFNRYFSLSENVEKMKKVFPVFCATCISSQKIGGPGTYFDMTIIDEASQCSTAAALIPIIRGKSLMLVGDPQQLNPVITLDKNINDELKAKYGVSDNYDYIRNSVYKAYLASDSVSQETLLRNHYRCAKEIIDFSNKKYYGGQLNIKSAPSHEKPLVFCDIPGNTSGYKNTAPEEAERIARYVAEHPGRKIGIITPFKNQKELIEHRLREERLDGRAECGTVHAFQGDEKDEILFSLALTDRTHEKTYGWLKNNTELLNVAVSRAKERLVIFSSTEQIERLHKSGEADDLYELASYVRQNGEFRITPRENPSRALGIKPYSTQTEEAFLTTLNHALSTLLDSEADYFVRREVQLSHLFRKNPADCDFFFRGSLDFVIYKKGFRGREDAVLALELDGPEHRADPKVIARDEKKKQICKNHGFDLIHVDNTYARRYCFVKEALGRFFRGR